MRHESITIGSFGELKKAVEKKLKSAGAALEAFVKEARRKGIGCVKIIHGRGLRSPGAPVVKEAVKKMLDGKLRKWTVAYASARRGDGGLGATYALLKKHA